MFERLCSGVGDRRFGQGEDLRQVSEFVVLEQLVDRDHCMYVPKHVDLSQITTSFIESEGQPLTPPSRAIAPNGYRKGAARKESIWKCNTR